MAASFFFYDLETSGIDPRSSRIMQFAGQRTDMELHPIGEPINELITLNPDVLPDPDAILLTGITPQQTIAEGLSEKQFMDLFYAEIAQPNTIFVGFNSIRFDDEFMRFLHWRNFYDAYEWQWKDGSSRWDILDVVRMTRALRPDGISWPYASDGKPSNKLTLLTGINKLSHEHAHDALGDVLATIEVAKLIKQKQPDLFNFLLSIRTKKDVAKLVQSDQPFVYTSGHFSSSVLHTSAVVKLCDHPQNDAALVYDLRYDPTPFLSMNPKDLVEAWRYTKDPDVLRLPVKTLKFNRCPAIAPIGVINTKDTEANIHVKLSDVTKHLKILRDNQVGFAKLVLEAVQLLDDEREQSQADLLDNPLTVDERLYEGFIAASDKHTMSEFRHAKPESLIDVASNFTDTRLQNLAPLYKARNYPKSLDSDERTAYEAFCKQKLLSGGTKSAAARYFAKLQDRTSTSPSPQKQYLLEELRLYGESILPVDGAD